MNNLDQILKADFKLGQIMQMGHEATDNMRDANYELMKQRQLIDKLFYFDTDVNGWIDKATGKVAALERETYVRKALLLTLAGVLLLLLLISIIVKMIN